MQLSYKNCVSGKTIFKLCKNLFYFRYFQILTSGFFAGVCTTAIMAPGERIKCILQVGSIMIIIIIIIDKEFTKSACVEVLLGGSFASQYM